MSNEENLDPKPPAGVYKAKLAAYGNKKTAAGLLAPTMMFTVTLDGVTHNVFWQGSYKEGTAREIALKALIKCGLKDPRDIADVAKGVDGKVLNVAQDYEIAVIHEKAEQGPNAGKKYPKVQWINLPGEARFKDSLDVTESKQLMQGLGLEADFMAILKEMGLGGTRVTTTGKPAAAPLAGPPPFDDSDMPI